MCMIGIVFQAANQSADPNDGEKAPGFPLLHVAMKSMPYFELAKVEVNTKELEDAADPTTYVEREPTLEEVAYYIKRKEP